MADKPLYQDGTLKVDYLPTSPDDHFVSYNQLGAENIILVLQRGTLRDLALTKRGGIERKIANINPGFLLGVLPELKSEGIGMDGLHVVLCQAYFEEERRIADFTREQKASK